MDIRPKSGKHAPFYGTKLSSAGHHKPVTIKKKKVKVVVPKKKRGGVR